VDWLPDGKPLIIVNERHGKKYFLRCVGQINPLRERAEQVQSNRKNGGFLARLSDKRHRPLYDI
jgi:hypothetical protein